MCMIVQVKLRERKTPIGATGKAMNDTKSYSITGVIDPVTREQVRNSFVITSFQFAASGLDDIAG